VCIERECVSLFVKEEIDLVKEELAHRFYMHARNARTHARTHRHAEWHTDAACSAPHELVRVVLIQINNTAHAHIHLF